MTRARAHASVRYVPTGDDRIASSLLGRTSPLVKLAIALTWLVGLTLTLDVRPALVLVVVTLAAAVALGSVPVRPLARAVIPVAGAASVIGILNAVFAAANADPRQAEVMSLGPVRLTHAAMAAGAGVAFRILSIGVAGACFALTTDATRLVDSLVQQGRVPERFAYGALAAYQAVPALADDLTGLRQAHRIRGRSTGWHPRLLLALLVLAVRRGGRLALAMDARGFASRPRTRYRALRWTRDDAVVAIGAAAVLVGALSIAGV